MFLRSINLDDTRHLNQRPGDRPPLGARPGQSPIGSRHHWKYVWKISMFFHGWLSRQDVSNYNKRWRTFGCNLSDEGLITNHAVIFERNCRSNRNGPTIWSAFIHILQFWELNLWCPCCSVLLCNELTLLLWFFTFMPSSAPAYPVAHLIVLFTMSKRGDWNSSQTLPIRVVKHFTRSASM